jgi:iron complex transport system substrate-binding protein
LIAWRSAVAAFALCAAGARAQTPITVRDGTGTTVNLRAPARRIASTVSSAIDFLIVIGAADRVAARTRYDTATAVRRATSLGGGLDPNIESLLATRPDLLIAWRGQSNAPFVTRARSIGVPVFLMEMNDTTAMYATMQALGHLTGITEPARAAVTTLRAQLSRIAAANPPRAATGVYVVSRSPLIIAGNGSFIADMIGVAGLRSPFTDVRGAFPQITLEALLARQPDVLVLPTRSNGQPLLPELRATRGWRELRAVQRGRVIEVDGEWWGRPGVHIGALVQQLAETLRRTGT